MSDSGMHEKKKLRQSKEIDRSLSPEPSGKMDILMKRSALPQSDRSTSPPGVPSDEEPRKKDKKKSEKEHKEKKRKAKKSTESSEVFFPPSSCACHTPYFLCNCANEALFKKSVHLVLKKIQF